MGARGLGGMSYFLHVFWDCRDLRAAVLHLHAPADGAHAARLSLPQSDRGARRRRARWVTRARCIPWESADKGVETTPPYGFGPGGEIVPILSRPHGTPHLGRRCLGRLGVLEGDRRRRVHGRRWASRSCSRRRASGPRARRADAEGRYHIRMVVGPDEYHEGVDDNAYTNVLARWNIRRAIDVDRLAGEGRLGLRRGAAPQARAHRRRARRLAARRRRPRRTASTRETMLYEQFAGFYEMDDVPIEKLRPRPMAADVLLGREVTLRLQGRQAGRRGDALLHPLRRDHATRWRAPTTTTTSPSPATAARCRPGIHAAVAAQFGKLDDAVKDFKMATAIDLARQHGQRRPRPAHGHHGRHLAGGGDGLRRHLQRRDEALRHRSPPAARAGRASACRCSSRRPRSSSRCATRRPPTRWV